MHQERHWFFGDLFSIINLPKVPFTRRLIQTNFGESSPLDSKKMKECLKWIYRRIPYLTEQLCLCDYDVEKQVLSNDYYGKFQKEHHIHLQNH